MEVDGKPYRSIRPSGEDGSFEVIDQTRLPHEFSLKRITSVQGAASAIRDMVVRGAPLIGATAAYGICLALHDDPSDRGLAEACEVLAGTRPSGVNLVWAIERMRSAVTPLAPPQRAAAALGLAARICDEDVETNRAIGEHGLKLIRELQAGRGGGDRVNILTHCNAGWLATVDWGTALAPVYMAHDSGIPVHVWVDETRPRNQGTGLTAWELQQHGVPHTVVVDNAGGHLMQQGLVDCCITGTDRTSANGDVCNKIGTYLKALAARDNEIPFYVALPGSSIDWSIGDGVSGIPIEQRAAAEVSEGRTADGSIETVTVTPPGCPVANYAFDVTPARLVSALITERGVCAASAEGLAALYPEQAADSDA
ncbi:MAG: S-methyl-5-thioribose-1-phosphate isomerase [Planctomycetota bacterium]|jgi:methylthioribose-1-phosphate isomerase